MKISENLFRLIKSLGKAEKRYFTIYANQHGGSSNYLTLFEAIDKQVRYDEATLVSKFKGTSIAKNFSASKKYLYDAILKSLKLFFADYCISVKLPDAIKDMRVLLNKGMVKQALKQYQKIESIYTVNEQFGALFDVLTFGEQLWKTVLSNGERRKKVREIYEQKQACLASLNNLNEIIYLKNEIEYTYNDLAPVRTTQAADELILFLEQPALSSIEKATSLRSKMAFYEAKMLIYEGIEDYANLKTTCLEALQLVQGSEMNQYFLLDWQSIVYHKLCIANLNLDSDDIQSTVEAFEGYIEEWKARVNLLDSINGQARLFDTQMATLIHLKNYRGLFNLENAITGFVNDYWDYLDANVRGNIAMKLAMAYNYFGENDKALDWVEKITENEKEYPLISQASAARFGRLLINLDMENYFVLESQLRSTNRFLTKHESLHCTEKLLLKFINKMSKSHGINQKIQRKTLNHELSQLFGDECEDRFQKNLAIMDWLNKPKKTEEDMLVRMMQAS